MARLVYSAIASLDGYVEDEGGKFDWAMPDEELHTFVNERERPIGTYLLGRRMYETMRFWEDGGDEPGSPPPMREYAEIWRAADKVVYSRTLEAVSTARTRLERELDPEAVRAMKAMAERDLSIGGAELAAAALAAGLVDEVDLYLHPISVGGGKPALPRDARVDLELLGHRRFESGVVHLRYRVS
ncbi:MAG TPA: dihydrofolate reductase family protein [Solirubrobacterales bacterium]|nr:dihydrofolate reductase family protein [Solirubrobacterales bacterium]